MSNLISKKDKNEPLCIIHCRKNITKTLLFKESTWNVVLIAAEIRGDELCHQGIYYLI